MVKVGIPRALLYYNYFPKWKTFFESLGAEVVVSDETTKHILNEGVKTAVDETCLPVKLFYGHVLNLKGRVDFLFMPRMVSVARNEYTCPKFLGLPDMIRQTVSELPPFIEPCVNMRKHSRQYMREIYRIGTLFSSNPCKIYKAYVAACQEQKKYQNLMIEGFTPYESLNILSGKMVREKKQPGELNIALIGHGYNIYDRYVSMNMIDKLQKMNICVLTPEMVPRHFIEKQAEKLPKDMFWTYGKQIIGSTYSFMENPRIDGIIQMTAFGCGPDSLVAELMEREAVRRKTVPFMLLTIDEHTGEAGLVTRIEAFLDMVRRKEVV